MVKKIVIAMIIIVSCIGGYAQYKPKSDVYTISELKVINEELLAVLDTIISMKSEITFYKDYSLFTMWFGLDSVKPDLIMIEAQEEKILGANHDLGLFDYKGNTFFVRGFSLDTTIFSKTDLNREVDFSLPQRRYTAEGMPILRRYNNFAAWSLRYKQGKFKILSFFSNDKNDDWFDYIEQEYNKIE